MDKIDLIQNVLIILLCLSAIIINLRQDRKINELETDSDMQYYNQKTLAESVNKVIEDMEMQNDISHSMLNDISQLIDVTAQLEDRVDDLYKVDIGQ